MSGPFHTTVWTWGSFSGSVTAGWQQTPIHSNQAFNDLRALFNADDTAIQRNMIIEFMVGLVDQIACDQEGQDIRQRHGVQHTVQPEKFDLLDMPGVLWKKFDSKTIASNLAFIGSIKDDILDVEELAMNLLDEVRRNYPDLVAQRYKLDAETLALPPYELLEAIGRKRGLLVRGGEVNTERCAIMLVDEFRACKWGRISLERPPQRDDLADFAEEDDE